MSGFEDEDIFPILTPPQVLNMHELFFFPDCSSGNTSCAGLFEWCFEYDWIIFLSWIVTLAVLVCLSDVLNMIELFFFPE